MDKNGCHSHAEWQCHKHSPTVDTDRLHAEVDGKTVATVRDNRITPACTQTVEAKGRVGLKFVTSRAPLTAVYAIRRRIGAAW